MVNTDESPLLDDAEMSKLFYYSLVFSVSKGKSGKKS